jgi:hypothetical protein
LNILNLPKAIIDLALHIFTFYVKNIITLSY